MKVVEEISAFGHELIKATHRTTFEITKDEHLTERGDCIVAVKADKSAKDLSEKFKEVARKPNSRIRVLIQVDDEKEIIEAFGSTDLTFSHPTDIVVRKSSYVCGRTVAIRANKAACDISRSIVKKLRNPMQKVKITLIAEA